MIDLCFSNVVVKSMNNVVVNSFSLVYGGTNYTRLEFFLLSNFLIDAVITTLMCEHFQSKFNFWMVRYCSISIEELWTNHKVPFGNWNCLWNNCPSHDEIHTVLKPDPFSIESSKYLILSTQIGSNHHQDLLICIDHR